MSIGIMALLIFGIALIAAQIAHLYWLYTVWPQTARLYASLSLPQFVCAAGTPGIPDDFAATWDIQNFLEGGKGPFDSGQPGDVLDLYDVDGWRLFRDVTHQLPNGKELRARMAATTVLGAPLFSIGVDDYPLRIREDLIPRAEDAARLQNLTRVNGDAAIVCYAYPALGLLCRDRAGKRWVIDLEDLTSSEVAPVKERRKRRPKISGGSHQAWSTFDGHRPSESVRYSIYGFMRYWIASSKLRKSKATLSKPPGGFDGKILPRVKLFSQEGKRFCAYASAQMVLNHAIKGFDMSQEAIGKKMSPPETFGAGTTLDEEVAGYKRITNDLDFEIQVDLHPTFAHVQGEINASRPFRNALTKGQEDHVRVTVGWVVEAGAGPAGEFMYIYDPWPMSDGERSSGGKRYFETWDTRMIRDHIYVVERGAKK